MGRKGKVWKGRYWLLPFTDDRAPRMLVSTEWLDEAGCLDDIAYKYQPEDSRGARVCEVIVRELPKVRPTRARRVKR